MLHINELSNILNQNLKWHKARANFLAQMIYAIIAVKSVNLAQVALGFSSRVCPASCYRRTQRFLSSFIFEQCLIVKIIKALFPLPRKVILIMDRTNWKFGKTHINLLVVSIACKGIGIPIFWVNLARAGNSKTPERIETIKKAIDLIEKKRIKYVLADREFVGSEWFDWLVDSSIRFLIRIKQDTLVSKNGYCCDVPIKQLFRRLKSGKKKIFKHPITIKNQLLFVSASRNLEGELLIVATPKYTNKAIEIYKRRWEIETLFGCLKTRGFCLEETKLTKPDRIEKLVFVLTIAFCWSYVIGIERNKKSPIRVKKNGKLEYSLFRYGYDWIRRLVINIGQCRSDFRWALKLFLSEKSWSFSHV